MKIQLAVAGSKGETEHFRYYLTSHGYKLVTTESGGQAAIREFVDDQQVLQARITVTFETAGYDEYSVDVEYRMGTDKPMRASWFSVHSSNVADKLRMVDNLLFASLNACTR